MFRPKYKLTNQILSGLTSIAEAKAIIERAKILPVQEIKLRRQALIRMTHSSTAIEGNILNIYQIEALLKGEKVDAPLRDIYEAQNYFKALKYIERIVEDKKPISKKVILKIHQLVTTQTLPKEQCGKYRTGPVYVVRRMPGNPDRIIYTAPEAEKVSDLMQDLISWLKGKQARDMHPIIVAAIAHREVAAIHPFADGNGRAARALATLVLYKRNYDFRRIFALEDYYDKDRQGYYRAINMGPIYRQADFTKWLEYFVEGFKEEIEQVKEKVLSLSIAKISKSSKQQIYLNKRQVQIVDFINAMGKITIKDAIDIVNSPKRTAQLELQKLKELGIIKQIGKGPAAAYVLL